MKKLIALLLVSAALLTACGHKTEPEQIPAEQPAVTTVATEAPTAVATEPPTEAPTEPAPVYFNPLNGQLLDAPFDKRIYAVTINNLQEAMPHIGVQNADIFMEMYVNGSIVRGLALYTDPSQVPAIGSVRSTRIMFTQLAKAYDLVVAHAGGSGYVLDDAAAQGIDNFNIDTGDRTSYSFRDKERAKHMTWDACLFADGTGLEAHAAEKGIDIHGDPDKDYYLEFVEDGTPMEGEAADKIHMTLTYKSSRATSRKDTDMIYNPETDKYVYHQYGKEMVDGVTGEPESFQNVVLMLAEIGMVDHGYQKANFLAGGEGYYANGGRIIPIRWTCESETSPFRFTTLDGQPLQLGTGNTYMAIMQNGSPVTWEGAAPAEPAAEAEEMPAQETAASADGDYL